MDHLGSIDAARSTRKEREHSRVSECVNIAKTNGLFKSFHAPRSAAVQFITEYVYGLELPVDRDRETGWKLEYERRRKEWKRLLAKPATPANDAVNDEVESEIRVRTMEDLHESVASSADPRVADAFMPALELPVEIESFAQEWSLNTEQKRAFDIVSKHSVQSRPEPLHMFLGGVGGTGKSRVIQALTSFFAARNQSRRLRLASFTGVAARNIAGTTLHVALGLDQRRNGKTGAKTKRDLQAMWDGVDYLLIDEVSMVGCKLLAKVSEALSDAKSSESAFGGMSVILAGDFAQLPPVSETRLYAWVNTTQGASTSSGQDVVMGKLLWLSFNVVVILREVMRQKGDQAFIDLLSRLREGKCTHDDYVALSQRVLHNVAEEVQHPAWGAAPTIIYDNAAKDAMNELAAVSYAEAMGRELHWYHARDEHSGKVLEDPLLLQALEEMHSGETSQRLGKIPLVLGMPVIISQNYDVNGGIVNGSIGVLKRIRYFEDPITHKRYLKSCVVLLQDATSAPLLGLEEGEFPVLQDTVSMTFTHPHSTLR